MTNLRNGIESKQRRVSVVYRRAVSDGNYGTESAEVSLEWFIDDDIESEQDEEAAEEMLRKAQSLVLSQLLLSSSERVRQAIQPRTTKAPAMASAGAVAADPADDEDPF